MLRTPQRRFFLKLALFLSPLLGLPASYFWLDPFNVLRPRIDYVQYHAPVINREFYGTEVFLRNLPRYQYKSFIFGSSRTMGFLAKDWSPWIKDPHPFHYDASGETLSGIWLKVRFLDRQCPRIENALLIVDHNLLPYITKTPDLIHVSDYRLTGESPFPFHWVFFKGYFANGFFVRCLDYKLFGRYRPYMDGYFEPLNEQYSPVSNDLLFPEWEEAASRTPEQFYADPRRLFYPRAGVAREGDSFLGAPQLALLEKLAEVFRRHRTAVRVVISPLYDQIKLNREDMRQLGRIFGPENVFDFSGINQFTDDLRNYYEISHFRPHVGRAILRDIYGKSLTTVDGPRAGRAASEDRFAEQR